MELTTSLRGFLPSNSKEVVCGLVAFYAVYRVFNVWSSIKVSLKNEDYQERALGNEKRFLRGKYHSFIHPRCVFIGLLSHRRPTPLGDILRDPPLPRRIQRVARPIRLQPPSLL